MRPKELKIGDLVKSTNGRDIAKYYVVYAENEKGYFILIDGKVKTQKNPKTKNSKHLEYVTHFDDIEQKIKDKKLYDFEIVSALNQFKKSLKW